MPWKPVLAAALLLLLGGAASPSRVAEPVEVVSTGDWPVGASVLTDDAWYVAVPAPLNGGYGRAEIRAYPLRPGGPEWSAGSPDDWPTMSLRGSRLVVESRRGGTLVALDARTGREDWQVVRRSSTLVVGDRVALLADDGLSSVRSRAVAGRSDGQSSVESRAVAGRSDGQSSVESRAVAGRSDGLKVVDLATGRAVWSHPGATSTMHTDGRRLITIDDEGRATVRAGADGRVLAGPRAVGLDTDAWGGAYPEPFLSTTVAGDNLYVYGTSFVSAFRITDLTRLWRTTVPRPPVSLHACRDAICAEGPEGVSVLDARTGTVRWSDPRWLTVTADGFVTGAGATAARVDPADGRMVRDLGQAVLAGDLALRADRERTWVVRLRDGRVVGRLPFSAPAACVRHLDYLACPTNGRSATVWRLR